MIVASHGIIGSSIGQFDPDALAFFARVEDAGGTLSATEQSAILTLVADLKDDGIWTKMKAIYPMVGASAAACAQNLKSSSFTGTFTATGWTFASTGVTPNGTSAYMDTGLNMAIDLTQNSAHFSVYSRTNISQLSSLGGVYTGSFANAIMIYPFFSNNAYLNIFSTGGANIFPNISSSLGLKIVNRVNSSEFNYFDNNSKATITRDSVIGISYNIYLGANNKAGSALNFDVRENAFSSIGDGLNDTEASNFYTAVQAFQTTLARQV